MFQEKEQKSENNGPMKIDSPDSVFEKEAKALSLGMIHGDQLTSGRGRNDGMIDTRGASRNDPGMVVPSKLQNEIESSIGNGDLLDINAKTEMKQIVGGNLDDVRIHTDSNANSWSNMLNAKAFTLGKDIYFGQGMFDTYTSQGKGLLAHELTHTLQNNGAGGNVIQRAKKTSPPAYTWGGTWTSTYETYVEDGQEAQKGAGVDGYNGYKTIDIWFTPNANVNALSFGLSQTVRSYKSPYLGGLDNDAKDSIKPNQAINVKDKLTATDEGTHIDQARGNTNPMYGTDFINKASTPLPLNKTNPDDNSMTKNIGVDPYKESSKSWYGNENTPAHIHDTPSQDNSYRDTGKILETAAIAVKGNPYSRKPNQEGMYYGSVEWGWNTDSNGLFHVLEIKAIHQGTPSSTFLKAAENWNVTKRVNEDWLNGREKNSTYIEKPTEEDMTKATTLLPTPLPLEDVKLVNEILDIEVDLGSGFIISLPKDTRIVFISGNQIRVVDGPFTGRTGYIVSTTPIDQLVRDERD